MRDPLIVEVLTLLSRLQKGKKARPILFSAPMVRAILEGKKTQTRRIVKPQPDNPETFGVSPVWGYGMHLDGVFRLHAAFNEKGRRADRFLPCPYGTPGDWLWVKETFASERQEQVGTGAVRWLHPDGDRCGARYRADVNPSSDGRRWKPAIHMPRCLSRITLDVTAVRVERLQDISEEDAIAEGMEPGDSLTAKGWFRGLWDQINDKRAPWSSNPFVWVVSFERRPTGEGR